MSRAAGKQLQVMAYRVDAERCWALAMQVAANSTCLRLPLRCPVVDDSLLMEAWFGLAQPEARVRV